LLQAPGDKLVADLHKASVRSTVREMVEADAEAALEGFTSACGGLSIEMRQNMLKRLVEGMSQTWAQQGRGAPLSP